MNLSKTSIELTLPEQDKLSTHAISSINIRPPAIQNFSQADVVQGIFPFCYHDRRQSVTEQVGRRQRLRHQTMDAEHERDARDRDGAAGSERGRKHHERRTGNTGSTFRCNEQNEQKPDLMT